MNQRAWIDKVLARYSGEFTGWLTSPPVLRHLIKLEPIVFRELLQNSDDAASKAVEIRFETKAYLDRVEAGDTQVSSGPVDLKQPVSMIDTPGELALLRAYRYTNGSFGTTASSLEKKAS